MRIPALVLALILPVIMVFSAALVIQAGIRIDSAEDLKQRIISRLLLLLTAFTQKFPQSCPGSQPGKSWIKQAKMHTLISESFITEILSPSKTPPDWLIPSMILRNGVHRRSIPMITGSSWALPPRRVKQNICTILISKKLWKTEPCS